MIKEISKSDYDKIKELENLFSSILKDNILRDFDNNPFCKYIVYLFNNKIVAFLNYFDIYDRIEIVNFNVLDEFQNKGIGNSLLKYLIDKYQGIYQNITLEVRVDNYKAIYLYEKYGFVKKAIRKNYYNGVDGILMEKELI